MQVFLYIICCKGNDFLIIMQVFTCMFFDVVLEKKEIITVWGVTKGWDMIISADRQCLFAVRGLFLLKTSMTGALVFW